MLVQILYLLSISKLFFFLQLMNIIYLIVTCISDKCVNHKFYFMKQNLSNGDLKFLDINLYV